MAETTLVRSFLDRCEQAPDATALWWHDARVTYAQLRARAASARGQIAKLDSPADATVTILARKSPDAIALVLACLLEGRRFVLPSVDLNPSTLVTLVEQTESRQVITPAGSDTPASERLGAIPIDCGANDGSASSACQPIMPGPHAEDAVFLLTTSGSTGVPKVVPLEMPAIGRFVNWAAETFDIGPGAVVFNYAPLNFDLCFLDIWTPLARGASVVLVDQGRATDGRYLAELVDRAGVTVIQGVPLLHRLLGETGEDAVFPTVRHAIVTGDRIQPAQLAGLPDLYPNAGFYNVYGCTETNNSFMYAFERDTCRTAGSLPIGNPLPGVDALIVDEDEGMSGLEGPGRGELMVSTPFQTAGYTDPTLNAGRFVARREGDAERQYFRTGDMVERTAEGLVFLEGRKDFRVKVRGALVNLQEIEEVLLQHDDVDECAVVAVPDDEAGNRVHAVLRIRDASRLNSLGVRRHCSANLGRMSIPSGIHFAEATLPKTSTGKIDRTAILKTYVSGV